MKVSLTETVSIGSIVEYYLPALMEQPQRYVVVSELGQWATGEHTVRSLDPETGYSYQSVDLNRPGFTLVSA
jgi:hypothetical protein